MHMTAEFRTRVFKCTYLVLKTRAHMSSRVTCQLTRHNTRLTAQVRTSSRVSFSPRVTCPFDHGAAMSPLACHANYFHVAT